MARPTKWEIGKFKKLKLKLYSETAKRYKQILEVKGKTIQQDLEDHVNKIINE